MTWYKLKTWNKVASIQMDISAPMTICSPDFVDRNWDYFRRCPYSTGGPGIIVRSPVDPQGIYFDENSSAGDFRDGIGAALEVKVEPYFPDDEIYKVHVYLDQPHSFSGDYDFRELMELAIMLADKTGLAFTDAGDEYELWFVYIEGEWKFLHAVQI